MQRLIAFVLALGVSLAAAASHAQALKPEELPDRFIAAWNTHDIAAFERLYTTDAIWAPTAEERTTGRDAILSEFAKIHMGRGWAVHTTVALKGESKVQPISSDVAVVYFHMDFIKDAKPVPGIQRALILVAKKSADGWRIAAGQLTKESPTEHGN